MYGFWHIYITASVTLYLNEYGKTWDKFTIGSSLIRIPRFAKLGPARFGISFLPED